MAPFYKKLEKIAQNAFIWVVLSRNFKIPFVFGSKFSKFSKTQKVRDFEKVKICKNAKKCKMKF